MSRDEAMSFLTIGQNLERADLTTRVLDARSESLRPDRGDSYDVVHWMAVLRSLAAYQPFRRAMPARPQGGSTLRFLLQDDRFPRAVSACLTETRSHLKGLARAEEAIEATTNAAMVVASAAVPRLTVGGLSEFLDEVQVDACNRYSGIGLPVAPLLLVEFHGSAVTVNDNASTFAGIRCEIRPPRKAPAMEAIPNPTAVRQRTACALA